MKWITRLSIRVNRTATCWLIRRFLDKEAEFIFATAEQVASVQAAESATGFDAPGAKYPHQNAKGLCSFAALVHERLAHDSGLVEMARIVQAADIQGQLGDHPAAPGLQLISGGFPLVTKVFMRQSSAQHSCTTRSMHVSWRVRLHNRTIRSFRSVNEQRKAGVICEYTCWG